MANLATVNSVYYVECYIGEDRWTPFFDDAGKIIVFSTDEEARKSAQRAMEQNVEDRYRVVKVIYQSV